MLNSRTALRMHSLTVPQIRFIELIIDQLTARGVKEAASDGNQRIGRFRNDRPAQ